MLFSTLIDDIKIYEDLCININSPDYKEDSYSFLSTNFIVELNHCFIVFHKAEEYMHSKDGNYLVQFQISNYGTVKVITGEQEVRDYKLNSLLNEK